MKQGSDRPRHRLARWCASLLAFCVTPLPVYGADVAGGGWSGPFSSARPSWLSEDQLIECAATLADGLRAATFARRTDRPIVLRLPVVRNRTSLPISDPHGFARQIAGLVNLRTGVSVRFEVESSADLGVATPDDTETYPTRLLLAPDATGEKNRVTVWLQVSEPARRAAVPVAAYTLRPGARVRASNREDVDAPAGTEQDEYAGRIELEAGELRFASGKLAKRLRLLADRTRRLPDGRLLVRVDLLAPDHTVKAKIRVEFRSEGGRTSRTTDARRHRFREGRADTIHLMSPAPADWFVVYLDD